MAIKASKSRAKAKKTPKRKPVTPRRIMEMVWDFTHPLMAEAALRLGVFDAMDAGAKTIDHISQRTQASPRGIAALLDGLVAIGLVVRRGEQFKLAPDTAAFLVHGKPGFSGGLLSHVTGQLFDGWTNLAECVRSGKPCQPVNQEGAGGEFFGKLVEDIFSMSFVPASVAAEAVLGKKDRAASVLDIAAGSGVWGIAMASKRPSVRVTAVDWPAVIPIARRIAERHGVAGQFSFVGGDILQADLGTGHHVATLGHILHSEGEARSRRLLKRVRQAMAPGGTIVIGEFLPDEGRRGPTVPLIFAVNMLINTESGSTYTFNQIGSWLKEAGFKRSRLLAAPSPSPLILATV